VSLRSGLGGFTPPQQDPKQLLAPAVALYDLSYWRGSF
jgi:hypothetical protein